MPMTMLYRILIPLDGAELTDQAVSHLHPLLAREDVEGMVLSVPPDGEVRSRGGRVPALFPHARNGYDLLSPQDPARVTLQFAKNVFHPSLIAIAPRERAGEWRWRFGSVADRILRYAPCPVLVTSRGAEDFFHVPAQKRFRRILIFMDEPGSDPRILHWVRRFARMYRSQEVLFKEFSTCGKTLPRILEASLETKADLVAVSVRDSHDFAGTPYGSTIAGLLKHCPLPLLIGRRERVCPVRRPALSFSSRSGNLSIS